MYHPRCRVQPSPDELVLSSPGRARGRARQPRAPPGLAWGQREQIPRPILRREHRVLALLGLLHQSASRTSTPKAWRRGPEPVCVPRAPRAPRRLAPAVALRYAAPRHGSCRPLPAAHRAPVACTGGSCVDPVSRARAGRACARARPPARWRRARGVGAGGRARGPARDRHPRRAIRHLPGRGHDGVELPGGVAPADRPREREDRGHARDAGGWTQRDPAAVPASPPARQRVLARGLLGPGRADADPRQGARRHGRGPLRAPDALPRRVPPSSLPQDHPGRA